MTALRDRSPGTVLVVGESLIDIVGDGVDTDADGGNGAPSRVSGIEFVGGSPANTAIGIARQGGVARLLTRVGRDSRGERIAAHLAAEAVELLHESWTSAPTSTARVSVEGDGSARYVFDIDWSLPRVAPEPVDLVHAGSIGLFLDPGADEVLRLLRELSRSCIVTLDPNVRPTLGLPREQVLRRFERAAAVADLVKLSDEDAAWLYPGLDERAVLERIRGLGPRIAVLTCGAEGAHGMGDGGVIGVEAVPVEVVDTISAGDSFTATLITCLLDRGVDGVASGLREAMERAACASAIAVSAAGANPPLTADLDELHASLRRRADPVAPEERRLRRE